MQYKFCAFKKKNAFWSRFTLSKAIFFKHNNYKNNEIIKRKKT